MKVLSIAVALAAILFLAYAFPDDYEEPATEPEQPSYGEEGEGESTTQNPCVQFEEQCQTNEGNYNGQNNGNQTMGNTMPPQNPQCEAWKQQCAQQNGGSTMPGGQPAPTQPTTPRPTQPTQPDMNNMTTPAPVPPNQNTTMPVVGVGAGR